MSDSGTYIGSVVVTFLTLVREVARAKTSAVKFFYHKMFSSLCPLLKCLPRQSIERNSCDVGRFVFSFNLFDFLFWEMLFSLASSS